MNVFGENLQFYRKQKNLTQEQLAEQFEVSRQTVSKWEAGASFPEMEKILQMCDLFSCDMDTLLRKDAAVLETSDSQGYENHMEKRRRKITFGVTFLILGTAVYEILEGFQRPEVLSNLIFMAMAVVAVLVLVVAGMEHDIYRKNHPVIPDFYTSAEKETFEQQFPRWIATGIGIILIGALIGMNGDEFPLRAGMRDEFYQGIFLLLVALGIGVLVYAGMGKEKYQVDIYNKENSPEQKGKNTRVGVWCGCIMMTAAGIFLVLGFVFDLWKICWVVWPVGGLLCGIAALILSGRK
ncbi:hypothetical protein C805_00773 [Eubacterium sp. 14-2]|uniref:helix-turn-helix domain-containing protein n=1 Tax=Eubacterium sp. 14-2 TaxID=1235790 RepID=UPI00033F61AD|nr:helix-turn-helix transcriptional regulator [Eubacterium sp. 14-2]EOT26672.1 hypothetical protein C805_00773 [Eubacterium sp. 14-2]